MNFDRDYILNEFPKYDYSNPLRPWEVNIDRPDGARNCTWQMQAFHYFWCMEQCHKNGQIGLSLGIPNLPYCLPIDQKDVAKLQHGIGNHKFPLIVASKAFSSISCSQGGNLHCRGEDVLVELLQWWEMLDVGGVLIAALADEGYSNKHGRSMEDLGAGHAWTPAQFFNRIVVPTSEQCGALLKEFNTFGNGMSFNLVLRKE